MTLWWWPFCVAGALLFVFMSIKVWEAWREYRQAREYDNAQWFDVKRQAEPHSCFKPAYVEAWNKASGHPYREGDVIECKECGTRRLCTGTKMDYAAGGSRYEWRTMAEDERVEF